jgi:hypothetical protein
MEWGNVLSKILQIGIVVLVLALVGSGSISIAFASPGMGGGRHGGWFGLYWDFDSYFTIGVIFSTINMVLSAILLITYIGNYRRTKAEFNLVLIIVAVTLLFYSLVANPIFSFALGYGASGLGPFFMLPDLFTLVTLSALLYLSLRY